MSDDVAETDSELEGASIETRRPVVLLSNVPAGERNYFRDDLCANCLEPLAHFMPALFCDDWCRTTAATVRYARGTIADGRIELDPKVRPVIATRLSFALVGGYHSLGRNVTAADRAFVIERDGGQCVHCGAPANELDHIDGSDNSPENLQVLCNDCHLKKTVELPRPLEQ